MKKLLLAAFMLLSVNAFSQKGESYPAANYGLQEFIQSPNIEGYVAGKAKVVYDAVNQIIYTWNPNTLTYDNYAVGGGAGATDIDGLSDGASDGSSVFLGSGAGAVDDGSANANTGIGVNSLNSVTLGDKNVGIGYQAMYNDNFGRDNVAIGHTALYSNVGNSGIVAIGRRSMYNAHNGASQINVYNTAIGFEAYRGSTSASANTGANNTAIGAKTMYAHTSGSNNTIIGYNQNASSATASNELNIDGVIKTLDKTATNPVVIIEDVLKITPIASEPAGLTEGSVYTNSTDNHIYYRNDVELVQLDNDVQDFTNLDNHFTYVKNADSNDYGLVGFNAPENVYNIDDKTIAIAYRYNNENDPSTVLDHAAVSPVGGLVLYDITDISKPVVLDTYKDNDLIGCMSVTVHGDILYVMSSKKGRVHVLDIKDRNNIVQLANFQYETSTHASTVAYRSDIHRSGNWLFVCGRYESSAAGKVYSINVTNPSVPVLVTTSATLGYWTYDLRSIGDKLYVTYYGGATPNFYSTFDINASTGALTNQTNVAKTNANGVSNLLYGNKFIVCEWNNNVTIYDVNPETFSLTQSIQTNTPDADDNRVDIMKKHDINLLGFAGYTSDRVGLQIYNEDFTTLLGTSYIDHLNLDIVQAIRFVGDYLFVLNKSGIHNMMIYKFNYNSFAKERNGHR